jgi:hypothetical protein
MGSYFSSIISMFNDGRDVGEKKEIDDKIKEYYLHSDTSISELSMTNMPKDLVISIDEIKKKNDVLKGGDRYSYLLKTNENDKSIDLLNKQKGGMATSESTSEANIFDTMKLKLSKKDEKVFIRKDKNEMIGGKMYMDSSEESRYDDSDSFDRKDKQSDSIMSISNEKDNYNVSEAMIEEHKNEKRVVGFYSSIDE